MRRRAFLSLPLLSAPDPVWIVAHRGAMRLAPENTIAAYDRAAGLGAHFVEVDVRTARDGALVLVHDATVDRTTNGAGAVDSLSLRDIRQLRPPVPTLAEALRWAERRGVRIDIDDKATEPAALAREIARAGMTARVVIEGPRSRLQQFAALLPGVDTMPKVTSVADVADAVAQLRTRIVRLSLPQLADPAFPAAVRAAGARVAVTILGPNDNDSTLRAVIAQGARIIETDFPELSATAGRL